MLVIYCNKTVNEKSELYNKLFAYYKTSIIELSLKQWKQEDINGNSCLQFTTIMYYFAFLYTLLFYNEYKEGILTLEELKTKYKYDDLKKCFGCYKISLSVLFETMGILESGQCKGINTLSVSHTWQVGYKHCLINNETETTQLNTTIVNPIANIIENTITINVQSTC